MPYGQSAVTNNHVTVQVDIHGPNFSEAGGSANPGLIGLLGKHPDFFNIILFVLEGIGATASSL